ncbi:MAG: plastocyanin/azurin family copper-binding protein [Sneathiella sp.]|uniref:plastocyanin/azurin family copper-binding protein n=1 Tax=Sneathiella sp. TaxID=1964365 RepID=UPI0030011FF1
MRITRRVVFSRAVAALAAAVLGPAVVRATAAKQPQNTEHLVEISEFAFTPTELMVRPGDTITWLNQDIVPHTATALDKTWDTDTIERGMSKSLVVTDGMNQLYYCRFHPKMTANITISS